MAGILQTRDAESIRQLLLAQVHQQVAALDAPQERRIVRVEVPTPAVNPLGWLAAQENRIKGYWVDRDHGLEVAAIGEADEIKGSEPGDPGAFFDEVAARLRNSEGDLRYYGGFRFGPWHASDPSWRPFGAYRFILPQFELIRRERGDPSLACNLVVGPGYDPLASVMAQLQGMTFPTAFAPGAMTAPGKRWDEPEAAHWRDAVREALVAIDGGALAKVVLARRVCFEFGAPVDPFTLVHRMQQDAGRCFQYCGSHGAGFAFIGASPELLYRRDGRRLVSEAVAGTRARGDTSAEDDALDADLRSSPKEQQEHRLVVDSIAAALKTLATRVRVEPGPGVLKLARLQHLYTRVEADLAEGVTDAALLRALHPTPAVGGAPAAPAMQLLARLERFDRGWYTGPVGWVARDSVEFAVALRCGLIAGSRLCLFSGAGIVRGSRPDEEWREIENKIGSFLDILQTT